MKKGCFVKIIVILTILVAAVLYIFQHHFDDWVVDPAKKFFSELFVSGLDEELKFVVETPEKDSLRAILKGYLQDKFSETKELSNKDLDWLADSIKSITIDSIISKDDLDKINKLIQSKGYERSAEN